MSMFGSFLRRKKKSSEPTEELQQGEGAQAHYDLGKDYIRKGLFDQAMTEYKRAIELDPNHVDAHHGLAYLYFLRGLIDEAITEHKRAIELKPDVASFHDSLGVAYVRKGLIDEAITECKRAIEIDPKYAKAHVSLAYAYACKRWTDQATVEFKRAIEIDPNNADTHLLLGNYLLGRGRIDEAITEYKRAVELKPDFAPFHHHLGKAYIRKGLVDEAITEYKRAVELKFTIAHLPLGLAYARKGLVDQAVAEYKRVIELFPDLSTPHHRLGLIYAQKGLIDEAITEYKRAIELEQAYVPKGVVTAMLGDEATTEAKTEFISIVHYDLGLVYDRKGWTDQAITEYKRAIELNPNHAKAHYSLGKAYEEKGLVDQAVAEYKRAVELDPTFADAHFNLAYVYYLSKRFDLAWRYMRIAEKLGMPAQKVNQLIDELRKASKEPSKEILPCKKTADCPYEYDKGPDRDIEGMPFIDNDPRSCPKYGHLCPEFMEDLGLKVEDLNIRATIHCWKLMDNLVNKGKVDRNSPEYKMVMEKYEETVKKYPIDKYPQYY